MPTLTVERHNLGINRAVPKFALADGQYVTLENLRPTDDALVVRPGRQRHLTQISATLPVTGLARFVHGSTTETLAFVGANLYSDKTGAWTAIQGSHPLASGANLEVAVWKGYAFIQDAGNNGPYKYDGTTFSVWDTGGDPNKTAPPRAKYLLFDAGRERLYLAGIAGDPSAIRACTLDDPFDWPLVSKPSGDQGAVFYAGKDDGEVITGAGRLGAFKFFFKQTSTYRLAGDGADTWELFRVFPVGCIAHRTIAVVENELIWTDGRRVYSFNGVALNVRFGWEVEPLLAETTLTDWQQMCAVSWDGRYILWYKPGYAVVWDARSRSWYGPWYTLPARVAITDAALDEVWFGSHAAGDVWRMIGTTDDGAAIPWLAESKHYNFRRVDAVKRARRLFVRADGQTGTITATVIGTTATGEQSVSRSLAFSGTGPRRLSAPIAVDGEFLGVRLQGVGAAAKVYQYGVQADVLRRV
jgi:hypothetical protein